MTAMFSRSFLFLGILAAPLAQAAIINARVVFFQDSKDDPKELYYAGAAGDFPKLTPAAGVGGTAVKIPVDGAGQVSLLTSPGQGKAAAVAKVPAGVTDAVFFLLKNPSTTGQGAPYQVLVADESPRALPRGGTFICNLAGFGARVALGESQYLLPPGKPAHIKRPEKRDGYNMSPLQLEAQIGQEWKPIKDTMLRFSENERYFILISAESGGTPAVKIYKQIVPQEKPVAQDPAAAVR